MQLREDSFLKYPNSSNLTAIMKEIREQVQCALIRFWLDVKMFMHYFLHQTLTKLK